MKAKTIVKKLSDRKGKVSLFSLHALRHWKFWFKKGFYAFGPDHSHADMEEWVELCEAEKMIKKLLKN